MTFFSSSCAGDDSSPPKQDSASLAVTEKHKLTLAEKEEAAKVYKKARQRSGLRQLALCADGKHESLEAKRVQCTALTLLSAAALFSDEGHAQVLTALNDLKRTRRRLHRFAWLVEACNRCAHMCHEHASLHGAMEGACIRHAPTSLIAHHPLSRFHLDDSITDAGVHAVAELAGDDEDGGDASTREATANSADSDTLAAVHVHVIECILMLINAIVDYPEDLKERCKLRAEFIRLQVSDAHACTARVDSRLQTGDRGRELAQPHALCALA